MMSLGSRPACVTGKVRYRDKAAALMALAKLQRQDKHGHGEQRAYLCHACKGWHLTSRGVGDPPTVEWEAAQEAQS